MNAMVKEFPCPASRSGTLCREMLSAIHQGGAKPSANGVTYSIVIIEALTAPLLTVLWRQLLLVLTTTTVPADILHQRAQAAAGLYCIGWRVS